MQGGNEEDVEEEQGDRRKNTVQCKQFHHATSPDKLRIDLSECGCNTVGHQKDDIVFRIRQQLQQRREHDKAQNAAGLNDISRCENTPLVKVAVNAIPNDGICNGERNNRNQEIGGNFQQFLSAVVTGIDISCVQSSQQQQQNFGAEGTDSKNQGIGKQFFVFVHE